MKILFLIVLFFFKFSFGNAENDILFYVNSAFKNNSNLNAERENLKAVKQNINISRSEFLPSVSLSRTQTDTNSTNRKNQSGSFLTDTNLNTDTKSFSVDQKIFQGFQGYNSLKKSKLEVEKARLRLKNQEQNTILNTVNVYYDLILKNKNKNFNLLNVDLFERQVEFDKVRLQKGEINLTDLAQSESSLAGANAKLISAKTELLNSTVQFERITSKKPSEKLNEDYNLNISLPNNLNLALKLAETQSPEFLIAKIEALIAEKELDIEKANFSPTASINYSKSENKDLSSTIDENDQEIVKATIKWPLIKGGKNISSIKKSKHKKLKSDLLLKVKKSEVKTSVINSWSLHQSAQSILAATAAQLKAAEIANEGISLEYDSGNTRTTLEVIQSRTLLLEARIAHAKSEKDFIISKFKILDQVGKLSLDTFKNL
jgi:outer membrane protein|tara:strand:+ start:46 stop:1341 length:1296 start_codon:yes stop_codon:yes gene_type:complete